MIKKYGVTIDEVLKLPAFEGAKLIAGAKGINNIIKYVDVMEVPDAANWVREQEMLLTTAFAIKNDVKAQEELIIKLAEVKASALCIKPGRFIDRIPLKVLERAEELNFPVIELPPEVPYIDIINQVLSQILSKKASLLEAINRIHDSLINVVLNGGGLQAICNKLSEITGYPIAVFNCNKRIVAFSGKQEEMYKLLNQLQLMKGIDKCEDTALFHKENSNSEKEKFLVTPIVIEKELYGYLVMFGASPVAGQLNMKALEQGAVVAALEFLKEKNVQETRKRIMKDLVNDLLEGNISNPDILCERGGYLGWNLKRGMQVIVADIDQDCTSSFQGEKRLRDIRDLKKRVQDIIKLTAKKIDPGAIVTDKSGRIVIILNVPEGYMESTNNLQIYIKKIAANIQQEVLTSLSGININLGIGRFYKELKDVYKGYREALEALDLGKHIMGLGRVVHFDDLGIYKILLEFPDKGLLKRFAFNYLQTLIEYDKQHGCDLINTLEAYLRNDKNICRTASELFVHRNTVRYRIDRINDILGVDLEDGETLFNIYFSLKALKIINSIYV